jgi:hypothetical protein
MIVMKNPLNNTKAVIFPNVKKSTPGETGVEGGIGSGEVTMFISADWFAPDRRVDPVTVLVW